MEISNSAQQYMSRLEWRVRASYACPVEYHSMGCLRQGAVVRAVVVKSNAGLARFRVSKHSNTTHEIRFPPSPRNEISTKDPGIFALNHFFKRSRNLSTTGPVG